MREAELIKVVGGASSFTSASFLSAISRGITTLYDLERALGTSKRMLIKGKRC